MFSSTKIIAVVHKNERLHYTLNECNIPGHTVMVFRNGQELCTKWKGESLDISLVISCGEITGSSGIALFESLKEKQYPDVAVYDLHYRHRWSSEKAGVACRCGRCI